MARLIDADKVKRAFIGNRYGTKAIEYVIDDAPTVKAIPILKLQRWLNKQDMPYKDYVIGVVEHLIECWEKENG